MIYLHGIETSLPAGVFRQADFGNLQQQFVDDKNTERYLKGIYADSGIETRHSIVVEPTGAFSPDAAHNVTSTFYGIGNGGTLRQPTTRERNDVFAAAASELAIAAARRVMESSIFSKEEIRHVITVSCTGFCNPGADLAIVQQLDLPHSTARYHLGFMGCNAAFPALRMAQQFCLADPDAVALVICIELCSLHFHLDGGLDTILANSLFADGVAACLVSARPPLSGTPQALLQSFSSAILPEGADDMAWRIGDHGFDIVLSRYVPRILGANIEAVTAGILQNSGLRIEDIAVWVVHPGGKSILDKIEKSLRLLPGQLEASRSVLRHFGNMSSATILFVLREILRQGAPQPQHVFAMAFGPGLTLESVLLELKNSERL